MTCSDSKDFLSYIVSRKTLHIIELNKHAYSYSNVMWGYLEMCPLRSTLLKMLLNLDALFTL